MKGAGAKRVCVDFDGVLAEYDGWRGHSHMGKPRPGAKEFLEKLAKKYLVVIFTTRRSEMVETWLLQHGIDVPVITTRVKPAAIAYIDDRALYFGGDFDETLKELESFKTHWEK